MFFISKHNTETELRHGSQYRHVDTYGHMKDLEDDDMPPMTEEQRLNFSVRTRFCGAEIFTTREIDNVSRNFKCGVSSSQEGRMTTWLPTTFLSSLLVGTSTGQNIVILCKSEKAYNLSTDMHVPSLPAGMVIVGNCTIDYDDTFRFLIYDGENLPIVKPTASKTPTSVERYEQLRSFHPRYFSQDDLVKTTFVLQWVGFYEHAAAFLTGKFNVGHAIGGLISTTEDALKPTRPVSVQIPNISIRRFHDVK